ncbi:MAG TPA: hypothetical protein VFV39_02715 [Limnobacter sp.]|nr:hypothetical protein [Limnobacter sp.]
MNEQKGCSLRSAQQPVVRKGESPATMSVKSLILRFAILFPSIYVLALGLATFFELPKFTGFAGLLLMTLTVSLVHAYREANPGKSLRDDATRIFLAFFAIDVALESLLALLVFRHPEAPIPWDLTLLALGMNAVLSAVVIGVAMFAASRMKLRAALN